MKIPNIFPLISTDFNEENIYLTFMKHCKFNTGIKINNNIQDLCINRTSEINKNMSLEEKINLLKEGNNYNIDSLHSLLQIIHNENH